MDTRKWREWTADYAIDFRQRGISCRFGPTTSYADILACLTAVQADVQFDASYDVLLILEESYCWMSPGLREMVRPVLARWAAGRGQARWALVFRDHLSPELMTKVADSFFPAGGAVKAFRHETEALGWLAAGRESAAG